MCVKVHSGIKCQFMLVQQTHAETECLQTHTVRGSQDPVSQCHADWWRDRLPEAGSPSHYLFLSSCLCLLVVFTLVSMTKYPHCWPSSSSPPPPLSSPQCGHHQWQLSVLLPIHKIGSVCLSTTWHTLPSCPLLRARSKFGGVCGCLCV